MDPMIVVTLPNSTWDIPQGSIWQDAFFAAELKLDHTIEMGGVEPLQELSSVHLLAPKVHKC